MKKNKHPKLLGFNRLRPGGDDRHPHRLSGLLLASVAGVLVGLIHFYVLQLTEQRRVESLKREVAAHISTFRARLEQQINLTLYKTQGIKAVIALHPDIDQQLFLQIAENLSIDPNEIRNIGLAPKNVIRMIYPIAGNEAALGLDYAQQPEQFAAVQRAMTTRQTVVAGPLRLVQGGLGIISRTPVFLKKVNNGPQVTESPEGDARYWGIISMVVDVDKLFRRAGIEQLKTLRWAIRGKDGLGARGDVFMGPGDLFNRQSILQEIRLPSGSWQIAAEPLEGWQQSSQQPWTIVIGGYAFALAFAMLTYLAYTNFRSALHLALYDQLTGLPNRRLFVEQLQQSLIESKRYGRRGALLLIDLDKFKPVNDEYGHQVGDAVLEMTAERMQRALRNSDLVSRVGGDEFLVMYLEKITGKLLQAIREPLLIGELEISISASIGATEYPRERHNIVQLIAAADQAMYRAKHELGGDAMSQFDSRHSSRAENPR